MTTPSPAGAAADTTTVELDGGNTYRGEMKDELPEPAMGRLDPATVLAALADPGRLATVRVLATTVESRCGALLDECGLGISKSTLSHHLKVLREAGVTHTRVEGTCRWVSLRRPDLDEAFPGLLDAVLGSCVPA